MKLFEAKQGNFPYHLIMENDGDKIYFNYFNHAYGQVERLLKKDVYHWLFENVGEDNYRHWEGEFAFKKKEDAMMFKLLWG